MSSTADDGFPMSIESLLASIFELLKERGAAREIAILANSDARGFQSNYDPWDGGTYTWSLELAVDLGLFSRLSGQERDDATEIIDAAATPFLANMSNVRFGFVRLVPRAVDNARWRDDAGAYVSGAGINNQGRVRSDNIASRECDGLLFRSESEIHLYRAFKTSGVTFAPLPVFLRGGSASHRLEPDFVLIRDGLVLVVEVDGDTYHRESPLDAHERIAPLLQEGAKIERVSAADCDTPEKANECAKRILQIFEKNDSALNQKRDS